MLPKAMQQVKCIAPDDTTNGACKRAMKDTFNVSGIVF